MKYLVVALLLISSPCFADVAVKTGYNWYDEEKESEYTGNTCYDSEIGWGGFVRFGENWIVRLDFDKNSTGNTLLSEPGVVYEQINLTQNNLILSGGYRFTWLYALVGVGYTKNEGTIEQYPSDPFSYEIKDGYCYSTTIGIEKDIDRFFVFLEARYLREDLKIQFPNKELTENTDNVSLWTGLGFRF